MVQVKPEVETFAKIKVFGIGGGGGAALKRMIEEKIKGVGFVAVNTDVQALHQNPAQEKVAIGKTVTRGLGAGMNPEVGRRAAEEGANDIRNMVAGTDMVFLTAGLGGGTGSGAVPEVAKIAREAGALTVAVVTKPFSFEGKKRSNQADEGVALLRDVADTVITIPNNRLRSIAPKKATMIDMFMKADEILHHSVKGITDLIMMPGLVNLDFADVKTIMSKAGLALMGIGIASGENRAIEAAEKAISHPLLEDIPIAGARGVLMNITCSSDITLEEVIEASDKIYEEVGEEAEIIWGQAFDESIGEEMRITVIATGIGAGTSDSVFPYKAAKGLRGKLRDVTPEDLENDAAILDEPTFMRNQEAVGENSGAEYRGYKGLVIDNGDLEVPTFLRRQAD